MNKNKKPDTTTTLSDLEGLHEYTDGAMKRLGRRILVGAAVAGFLVAAAPNGEGDSGKPNQDPLHTHVVDVNVEQVVSDPQDVIVKVS